VIDRANCVVQLCIEGSCAEFDGRPDIAESRYRQAWDAAQDDYEAGIAAHYLARVQATPADSFHWNWEALRRAEAVADDRVQAFLPSLYLSMGFACKQIGDLEEAQRRYSLAAALGYPHQNSATAHARRVVEAVTTNVCPATARNLVKAVISRTWLLATDVRFRSAPQGRRLHATVRRWSMSLMTLRSPGPTPS